MVMVRPPGGREGDLEELARVVEAVDGAGPERETEDFAVADRPVVGDELAGLRVDLDEAVEGLAVACTGDRAGRSRRR